MAQLCSAVDDGHLYILAGQSQGTWQVSEKGEVWLRQRRHTIPAQGESVYLDHGTYLKLKDMGYLYIKGIEYDKNRQELPAHSQDGLEAVVEGLPLVLRLKERTNPGWELALDLTKLNEAAWDELQSHHLDYVTASDAIASISQKQLIFTHYLLRVYPSLQPYKVYRENSGHRHAIQQAPETPGLISTWQGNVFIERAQQRGIWRRRMPGGDVPFSGELLWLAKADCNPEWPGKAEHIGTIFSGWQLWHLEVNEEMPASWESLQKWFSYRSMHIAAQRQNLEIISPPTAITEDGGYVIPLGKQVLIACYPPSRIIEGLGKQAILSAEPIDRSTLYTDMSTEVSTLPFPADQVNYFRWSALHPDEYRIRMQGDASAEPLLIKVETLAPTQPNWLRGLTCTVTSTQNQQTFQAFNGIPHGEPGKDLLRVNQFAPQELATLTWTLEPEQLPIRVSWNFITQHDVQQPGSVSIVQSGDELTRCWQEQIWPARATSLQAKVTLDARSFGCIQLSILIRQPSQTEKAQPPDERLVAQLTWLSRMIAVHRKESEVPVPASTRSSIRRFRTQVNTNSSLSRALEKLSLANTLPTWVLFRLRTLLEEPEEQRGNTGTPDVIESNEEIVRWT